MLRTRFLLHNAGWDPARDAVPLLLIIWLMVKSWRHPSLWPTVRGCCTQVPWCLKVDLGVPAMMLLLLLLLLHLRLLVPVCLRIGAKPRLNPCGSRLALHREGSWGVAVLRESRVLLLMRPCLISQPRNACLASHAAVSRQRQCGG